MNTEDFIKLHDRSTRGGDLSAKDQRELQEWYRSQDEEELELLSKSNSSNRLKELEKEVRRSAEQLTQASQQFQRMLDENKVIKARTRELDSQLKQKTAQA